MSLAKGAVRGGDEDATQLLAVAGANLHDARIECTRCAIGAQNQLKARSQIEIESAQWHRVEIGAWRFSESLNWLFGRTGGDERGSSRGVQEALGA